MSTLRISNIEAKADSSSPTVDEQLRFTNSDGDLMLYLDGRTAGITTVGINTTNQTIKFDANNNVMVTGIITATEFHGTLAVGTSVTYGDNEKAYFGNGLDMALYHDGNNSYIQDVGYGQLRFLSNDYVFYNAAGNENLIRITENTGVSLYDGANTVRLATTSQGIDVTGHSELDNVNISGVTTFTGHIDASGDVYISDKIIHAGDTDTQIRFHADDKFRIELGGVTPAFSGLKSTSGAAHAKWGINVATPQAALHIDEAYNHQGVLRVTNGNQNSGYYHQLEMSGTNNVFALWKHFDGSSFNNTHAHGSTGHIWYIDGVEKVRVHSNGNVGIGTEIPQTKFEVSSATGTRIRARHTNVGGARDAGFDIWSDDSGTFAARASLVHSGSAGKTTLYAQNRFNIHSDQTDTSLYIARDGKVGIGTELPDERLHIYSENSHSKIVLESNNNSANNGMFWVDEQDSTQSEFYYSHPDNKHNLRVNGNGFEIYSKQTNSTIAKIGHGLGYNDFLVPNGKVVIGHNASVAGDGSSKFSFQLLGTTYVTSGLNQQRYANDVSGPSIILGKSRATSIGTHTIVQNGDQLGKIRFYGSDGNDFNNYGAEIAGHVDGSPGSDDMPGRLVFKTTADGANSPTERLRITSNGGVIISNAGTFPTSTSETFTIQGEGHNGHGTSNTRSVFNITAARTSNSNAMGLWIGARTNENTAVIGTRTSSGNLAIETYSGGWYERLRIRSDGRICINTTDVALGGVTGNVNIQNNNTNNHTVLNLSRSTANERNQIRFLNPNGNVGSVVTSGTSTSFNTSSDYRLKENEVAISNGIARLKQLKPYRFNFKTDSSTILDGFFAHEVSSVVPESITGTKDAVVTQEMIDAGDFVEGTLNDPIHQSIDHSKLVPLLVAALQEAVARIEALEGS